MSCRPSGIYRIYPICIVIDVLQLVPCSVCISMVFSKTSCDLLFGQLRQQHLHSNGSTLNLLVPDRKDPKSQQYIPKPSRTNKHIIIYIYNNLLSYVYYMCTYENPSPLTNFRHLDTGHLHGYISSYSTVHLPKWMMHRLSAACFAQRFCCTTVMASRCRLPRGVAMKLRCGELGKLHCCAFQIQTLSWQNQNTWCRLVIFCLGGLSSAC